MAAAGGISKKSTLTVFGGPQERNVRAPRGTKLTCRSWQTEAPFRMIQHNLEVGEDPKNLIIYGGTGRAARSWDAFDGILSTLRRLKTTETLLVQSGKPVGVFETHANAPRVLIANSNVVANWATWDNFRMLEAQGLTMYGQMTAGSWIYIGTQGILQGTYETFNAAARKYYGGTLRGHWVLSAGLGGMGGAQPLAATMLGGAFLAAEVDRARIQKRLDTGYLDEIVLDLDRAIDATMANRDAGTARSIGWLGNAVDLLQRIQKRGLKPDLITDQTSAHDPLNGYVPHRMTYEQALELREQNPGEYQGLSLRSMAEHVNLLLSFHAAGVPTFDYGNNLRGMAKEGGVTNAFDIPGFVPEYIRPLFCEGKGPFRWVALSGDPADIHRTDRVILEEFTGKEYAALRNWINLAHDKVSFQGLPSRICWLGYGDRARLGLRINELVRNGAITAPIAIGRDHLDCGSVASPNRETEGMLDGSDAIADWPLLNAMLNVASGATWVSIHQGGGVGIPYALHAGMVVVADGSRTADRRLKRVLTNDPGIGIARHVDAGYQDAAMTARTKGVDVFLG